MPYRTIIIEDDSMVAAIDRQYVESDRRFLVQKTFKSGGDALEFLKDQETDLIILDYYTPAMTGLEFIDALHRLGKAPSIIMVTSASDADIVRALLSRGVLDYLVKPFEFARFRQAMDKFLQLKTLLAEGQTGLDQRVIDRLLQGSEGGQKAQSQLGKGLSGATLALIRDFLSQHRESALTSEEIAEGVGLSRITIRRYVNHMVETEELVSTIDYQTGGRPSIRYRYMGAQRGEQ